MKPPRRTIGQLIADALVEFIKLLALAALLLVFAVVLGYHICTFVHWT